MLLMFPDFAKVASLRIGQEEDPKSGAARLVIPLVDAISQGTDDPFKNR